MADEDGPSWETGSGCDEGKGFSVVVLVGGVDVDDWGKFDMSGSGAIGCRWSRVLISTGVELSTGAAVACARACDIL